ncbi:MAG TPA: oxidoreductase [Opitutaceae bacterium]|nr:oxidoreductase [Opitutaceae bacterium]
MKTAWIAGSSGLVGSHCLQGLLDSPEYMRVIALGRRVLPIQHPKLLQSRVDFAVLDPMHGVNDVFCCLGTTIREAGSRDAFRRVDYEFVLSLAEAAVHSGGDQFLVVTSAGAAPNSRNFYLRVKGEVERDLAKWPFACLHIFRPSLILGPRKRTRPAEVIGGIATRIFSPFLQGKLVRWRPIHAADIASAMLHAAQKKSYGRHVYENPDMLRLAAKDDVVFAHESG